MGGHGHVSPPPNAHETAEKLVIKQILYRVLGSMTKFKLGHNKFFFVIANIFLLPNVYETKKVGHEQGLSIQLSIGGHFFPRCPPQTKLSRHISALWYNQIESP